MVEIFKAPEIGEIMGVSFTPTSLSISLGWAMQYRSDSTLLSQEEGKENCFEYLSKKEKAGLITCNTLSYLGLALENNIPFIRDGTSADFDNKSFEELKLVYPIIEELSDLDIIVATMPICSYYGRTFSLDVTKIRTTISFGVDSWIPPVVDSVDIDYLKNEIEIGRKIIMYYPSLTPTIYNSQNFAPLRGLMLRYKRFQP